MGLDCALEPWFSEVDEQCLGRVCDPLSEMGESVEFSRLSFDILRQQSRTDVEIDDVIEGLFGNSNRGQDPFPWTLSPMQPPSNET